MKFFLSNPETGKPDEMVTLTVVVTFAVLARFLLDGLTLHVFDQVLTFSKIDASVYLALLGPVLGSHSYIRGKGKENATDEKN